MSADERGEVAWMLGRVIAAVCQEGWEEGLRRAAAAVSAKGFPVVTPQVRTVADQTGVDVVIRFRVEIPAELPEGLLPINRLPPDLE